MTDKAWKRAERRVARSYGGERTPLSGANSRHTSADAIDMDAFPWLFVETKYRKNTVVHGVLEALDKKAKRHSRHPIVLFEQADGTRWFAAFKGCFDSCFKSDPNDFRCDWATQIHGHWLQHEVGPRLVHGKLVASTMAAAEREGKEAIVALVQHRKHKVVVLVPA